MLHAVTSAQSLLLMRGQLGYLRACGFEPAALCSPGPQVDEMRAAESVPVFTVAMEREISPLRDLLSLLRIFRLLRRVRPIICNAGTPKAGLLVGLAAWATRVPCRVYTMRGLRLETVRGTKAAILRITERLSCACAHRVICVSPSLRQRALDFGLAGADKLVVLGSGSSNGVDATRFSATPEVIAKVNQIRQEHQIRREAKVIGYVGRLTRDKGLPELLQAYKSIRQRYPSTFLILVGEYESGDPLSWEQRAAVEGDSSVLRIPFTADIAPLYLLMDIFVLPTHREGFPNAVLEAQAAGKPVITTTATGALDSVVHGVTGLTVATGDFAALAGALERLLDDPAYAAHLGRAGRDRILREFGQEKIWQALAQQYLLLAAEAGVSLKRWTPANPNATEPKVIEEERCQP